MWCMQRVRQMFVQGVDDGVKTLYSPFHFEPPPFRARTFLHRGNDRDTKQRHQDAPTRAGPGCVRARCGRGGFDGTWRVRQRPGFVRPGRLSLA